MPTFLAESIGWISTSLFLISILLPRSRPILALGIFAAFLSIPLQAMPKKKRCLAAIADVVSRETIEAAQAAETSPPSGRLSISLSDQGVPTPAISSIDWAPLIGKRIVVELKTSQGIFEVPQLVISMAFLDTHGKDVVSRLRTQSTLKGDFIEAGIVVVHTKTGTYESQIFTGLYDRFENNGDRNNSLDTLLEKVRRQEGNLEGLDEIEFYHTHPEAGEPMSVNDVGSMYGFNKGMSMKLESGRSVRSTAYVIPQEGPILFRNSRMVTRLR